MSLDIWRRICRRLHNPTSQREKREVLAPYRLAVAKVAAAAPLQVGRPRGGGAACSKPATAAGPPQPSARGTSPA